LEISSNAYDGSLSLFSFSLICAMMEQEGNFANAASKQQKEVKKKKK